MKNAKIVISTRKHYEDTSASKYLSFNLWEKGSKKRVYINDYKRRTIGYIDQETKEVTLLDNQGLTSEEINTAIVDYLNEN